MRKPGSAAAVAGNAASKAPVPAGRLDQAPAKMVCLALALALLALAFRIATIW
jgi:hypothetical protein